MKYILNLKALSPFILALLVLLINTSIALADATGFWACSFKHQKTEYPQNLSLQQTGQSVTGSVFLPNNPSPFALVTGTITGDKVAMNFKYISSAQEGSVSGRYLGDSGSGTWSNNINQNGTFICNRTDSGFKDVTSQGQLRKTALSLFCNRGGQGLSIATCTATVGDTSAPPRKSPSGKVQFIAFGGFSPESADCSLLPTALSPGVSSCSAQFQIASGFPIGSQLPIDAVYIADTEFSPSSASHQLINAGCVGSPEAPCSGAVALGFVEAPKIVKKLLETVISCGGSTTSPAITVRKNLNRKKPAKDKCNVAVSVKTTAGKVLAEVDVSDLNGVSEQILKELGAKAFANEENMNLALSAEILLQIYAHESQQQLQGSISQLSKEERAEFFDTIANKSLNNKIFEGSKGRLDSKMQKAISDVVSPVFNETLDNLKKNQPLLVARRKRISIEQEVAKGQIQVAANGEQKLRLKMNRWFTVLTSASKLGQANSAPLFLRVSSTRSGKVPSGASKKVIFDQQISAFLPK